MRKRRLLIEKIALLFISIIVLVVLIFTAGLVDPAVQFADPGLEAAVREKLEKPEKPIHKSDLLTITELDASGREISNLQGVEYLRQLVNLNLADNFVKDLTPLASLYKLNELNLRNNEIVDLEEVNFEAITGLPIRKLNLQYNVVHQFPGGEIRLEDIRPLRNLTLLEELELRYNHIEDINALSRLTNLKVLDLRDNLITDISPLKNLTALEELNLRDNDLGCIAPLADLEELLYLNIHSNNNIETIEPIAGLVNLKTLIMRNVPVGDQVTALRNLTNLQRLNIRNCAISDTAVIGELMAEGALQDDPETGEMAKLNIRDNKLPEEELDPYASMRPYWSNISIRAPFVLPSPISLLEPPTLSLPAGFYMEEITLGISHSRENVKILYTLDGSIPNHEILNDSFVVMQNYPDGELDTWHIKTHIYNFALEFDQSNIPNNRFELINTTMNSDFITLETEPFKAVIIRTAAYCDELGVSDVVSATYFLYPADFKPFELPVISIITEPKGLFDYYEGIYVAGKEFNSALRKNPGASPDWRWPANFNQRGIEWEREAYFEFYESGEINHSIAQDVGIRIDGNSSRSNANKSIRLNSRIEYGQNYMEHEFFSNFLIKGGTMQSADKFSRLVLRNSGQDSWNTLMRDGLCHTILRHYPGVEYQAYRPAVHFINGIYWGILNIRERYDQFYFKQYYDIAPKNLVIIANEVVQHGKEEDLNDYLFLENISDLYDPTTSDYIDALTRLVDIEALTYYNIGNLYLTHSYWPIRGTFDNVYWRKRVDHDHEENKYGHDGKWRWVWKDFDKSFGDFEKNMYIQLEKHDSVHKNITTTMWTNKEYLFYFLNTLADEINTTFKEERLISVINNIYEEIMDEKDRHYERWLKGEEKPELFIEFAVERPKVFLEQTVEYFNLDGVAEIHLFANESKGLVKINSIEISRDTIGIEDSNAWTGLYFKGIPIQITAIPKPGHIFSGWEEIEEANDSLELILTEDISLTPIFIKQ